MKECEKLPKYPRFANLARSVLALHVPAQNCNKNVLLDSDSLVSVASTLSHITIKD
jgi:hypothetical protein